MLPMPQLRSSGGDVRPAATGSPRRGALRDRFGRVATLLGAKISDTFMKVGFGNGINAVHIVTLGLIVAMTVTLFITQLQLMRKNMPADALTGPFAQQQKMMLYLFPLIFAIGGINFPVGVLIYWFASNLWTMGQQFYVIRRNPAPGTPAYDAWELRRKAKGKDLNEAIVSDLEVEAEAAGTSVNKVIRKQPPKQTRSHRKV